MFEIFSQRLTSGGDFMWTRVAETNTLYDAIGWCRDRSQDVDMLIETLVSEVDRVEVQLTDRESGALCYRISACKKI